MDFSGAIGKPGMGDQTWKARGPGAERECLVQYYILNTKLVEIILKLIYSMATYFHIPRRLVWNMI